MTAQHVVPALAALGETTGEQIAEVGTFPVIDVADRLETPDVGRDHAIREEHRSEPGSEEPGGTLPASFGRGVEADVVGHLAVGSTQLASDDRPQVGILQALLLASPGLHQGRPATVVTDPGTQAADDRGVLHPLRHLRQQLTDLDTGNVCRDRHERATGRTTRLRIPRLQLARSTGQPQQDHVLLLLLDLGGDRRILQHVQHRHVLGKSPRSSSGSRRTEEPAPAHSGGQVANRIAFRTCHSNHSLLPTGSGPGVSSVISS